LLPALGIILVYRLARKQYVNLTALLFGIGLPAGLMLAWQFLITYYGDEGSSIRFLPFAVMEASSGYLAPKLFLSILFPLSVLISYFKQVLKDTRMALAWLVFAFGILYTYLFAETGQRFLDGNFGWSGEIALVLLFAVSTLFWLENSTKRESYQWWLYAAWSLHVLFGLIYYSFCVLNYSYL
jgi:hypothetical protein